MTLSKGSNGAYLSQKIDEATLIWWEESAMPIDPNNPFGLSYAGTENSSTGLMNAWGSGQQDNQQKGGTDTFDSLNVGTSNTADNWGEMTGDKTYDDLNGGTGNGNGGGFGDPTIVNTAVCFNPTFIGDNFYQHSGSIGLYGRSRGLPAPNENSRGFCFGVMGQSSSSCGVFGMVTQELVPNPLPLGPQPPATGIGVVGRAMDSNLSETYPLHPELGPLSVEYIMGQQIGVLGHAFRGPGVRGHGSGPLLPATGPILPFPVVMPPQPPVFDPAPPGGVFSSGTLASEPIPGAAHFNQVVSQDAQPQLRLTPSNNTSLPAVGSIGDFFLQMVPGGQGPNGQQLASHAVLWICTFISGINEATGNPQPWWQQVQLGPPTSGGA
jgi:hypothetical protein